MWLTLAGVVSLVVALIIAIGLGIRLDVLTSRLLTLAAAFFSVAIVILGIVPTVTDNGFLIFCTVISSIATGLGWFFILTALIRFASGAAISRSGMATDAGRTI